jgi:putative transposase
MVYWLNVKEVAELYEVTERTIRKKIADKNFDGNAKETSGAKNTKTYVVDLYSLPIDKQKKYLLDNSIRVDIALNNDVSSNENTVYTLGELKNMYEDKFEDKLDEALKKKEAVLKLNDLKHGEKEDGVKKICEEYGYSQRALYMYKKQYEESGIPGLIRKPKSDKGSFSLADEAVKFIKGVYLQPIKPKKIHVLKIYNEKAKEMGWEETSLSTISRITQSIAETEKYLAFQGEKAYKAKYSPCITRTYEDLLINEIWVGDGHTLAIWTPESGKTQRYTMSAWMDMRSRAIVGWCIAKNSNSTVIAAALRSGILGAGTLKGGMPGTCYMDNGLDYKSGFLNAETKEEFFNTYDGVFKSFDINTRFAIPYNAKAKPIERFFQTFSSNLSRYVPGFCGESIGERPHNLEKDDILIRDIGIENIAKIIDGYMDFYNHDSHGALGNKSPAQVMSEVDYYRNDMPTAEELDMFMAKADIREISGSGIKKFGKWYWNDDIIPFIGKKCVIRYDLNDIGELYVYVEGRLVCKVQNKELLSMKATEDDIKKWQKLKAKALSATREAVKSYGVKEDDVRRMMLSNYVDNDVLDVLFTPKQNKKSLEDAKVIRLNERTKKGFEKQENKKNESDGAIDKRFMSAGEEIFKKAIGK